MTEKILVVGSSSLVGSHFVQTYAQEYQITAIGRKNLFQTPEVLKSFTFVDIRNQDQVFDAIRHSDSNIVLNYAADTGVDICEKELGNTKGQTYLTNYEAVLSMIKACQEGHKKFFQISTDFVFDGSDGPYDEEDATGQVRHRLSWYGQTKFLAEEAVRSKCENFCMLRIGYPYRADFSIKTDIARTIINMYQRRSLFPLFTDQVFTPTLVDEITNATNFLLKQNSAGIYHIASLDTCNPFEFAKYLLSAYFSKVNVVEDLKEATLSDFNRIPGRAPRPIIGGLNTKKINALGFRTMTISESIREFVRQSKLSC